MRIAIDARILASDFRGGILVYTERLIEHLAELDHDNTYQILLSGLRLHPDDVKLRLGPNFKKEVLPVPDREFFGKAQLWTRLALPAYFTLRRTDVYHLPALHELTPFRRVRRIITIHDLRSTHLQDVESQDLDAIRRSCQVADCIISVSDFTKGDIVRQFGVPESKVRTVPLGVDEVYQVVDDAERLERFRERMGLKKPFLLSLGLVPRKNIERLLQAYAAFRYKEEYSLVLAGFLGGGPWIDRYRAQIKELDLTEHVILPGAVPGEDLVLLYNTAFAFVFPSLCEGFGIPVLEAMACGTPVVTSNISALPEVAGDAALLVDPHDPGAIREAMEALVQDRARYDDLVRRGRARAAEFSWGSMAEKILEIYRTV